MRLRRVQQRHLRAILRVPYTDRITNDQILDRAGVPDIEMIVRKMQLRWAGHVARMSDNRIPKQLLFGELTIGTRTVGRPLLRWKDSLKDTLKQSNISTTHWQDTGTDRSAWRRSIHDGLVHGVLIINLESQLPLVAEVTGNSPSALLGSYSYHVPTHICLSLRTLSHRTGL